MTASATECDTSNIGTSHANDRSVATRFSIFRSGIESPEITGPAEIGVKRKPEPRRAHSYCMLLRLEEGREVRVQPSVLVAAKDFPLVHRSEPHRSARRGLLHELRRASTISTYIPGLGGTCLAAASEPFHYEAEKVISITRLRSREFKGSRAIEDA